MRYALCVMRIGIDIRTLMDAQYSGVSEYTLNLVKEILKLDKKNEYKLFYNSGKDMSGCIPDFTASNAEIISARYPNKIFNFLMQKILHWPKIDRLLGVDPASNLRSSGVNLFFMPNIGFASLSSGCKKIITVHDLSFLRYKEFFSLKQRIWHRIINAKKFLNKADIIVAVSENTKKDIVELCDVNPEQVKVIYSGIGDQYSKIKNIDMQNFAFQDLALIKKKYNLPDKYILYLGTLEPRKNVEGIIRAFNELRMKNKELAEIKLVIAGGNGWKSKNIFNVWEKSKYKDDIKFLGYVNSNDKAYLYNLASVFVYPSFYEGFGFPPLEAMACGTPVITSFTSSIPEVVGEAAIMVDPYNITGIANAMEQVLTNQELQNDLIKKGLEQARRFSWEKTAKEYLEVFGSFA